MNSDNHQDSLSLDGNNEYTNRSFENGLKNANNDFLKLFAANLRNLKYGEQIRYRGQVILNKNTFEDILTAFSRIYQLLTFEFEKISSRITARGGRPMRTGGAGSVAGGLVGRPCAAGWMAAPKLVDARYPRGAEPGHQRSGGPGAWRRAGLQGPARPARPPADGPAKPGLPPEAAGAQAVQAEAGRLGAAAFSPWREAGSVAGRA